MSLCVSNVLHFVQKTVKKAYNSPSCLQGGKEKAKCATNTTRTKQRRERERGLGHQNIYIYIYIYIVLILSTNNELAQLTTTPAAILMEKRNGNITVSYKLVRTHLVYKFLSSE